VVAIVEGSMLPACQAGNRAAWLNVTFCDKSTEPLVDVAALALGG